MCSSKDTDKNDIDTIYCELVVVEIDGLVCVHDNLAVALLGILKHQSKHITLNANPCIMQYTELL